MEGKTMIIGYVRKSRTNKITVDPRNIMINRKGADSVPLVSLFDTDKTKAEQQDMVQVNSVTITQTENRKVGVLVAIKNPDGKVVVGWSRCHETPVVKVGPTVFDDVTVKGDKFNAKQGKAIAISRATLGHSLPMPRSFIKQALKFVERAKRYFRVNDVTIVGHTESTPVSNVVNQCQD